MKQFTKLATTTTDFFVAPLVLHFGTPTDCLTDSKLFEFCQLNGDWRIERTPDGDLILMPPGGGESGRRNLELICQLGNWNKRCKGGAAFDSSTGFVLPNGAMRSPTQRGYGANGGIR